MSNYCHGNGPDHCCYVNGQVCPFLEENTVPGRRWACGLYRQLGDWNLVHTDPRYLAVVKPVWDEFGVADCGDFKGLVLEDDSIEYQCCFKGDS